MQNQSEWEIVQAATCELVGSNEYELSMFLRGRLGSTHAMGAPHAIGARIVKLDNRLARADVSAHEWQEALHVIAPPAGALASSNRSALEDVVLPHAAVRPWAPHHLHVQKQASGDLRLSWVRCARVGGDTWGPGDPPLGAPSEGYALDILDGDDAIRSVTTAVPSFLYSVADQTADFGAPPTSLRFRVAQLGESGAAGLNSELTITL